MTATFDDAFTREMDRAEAGFYARVDAAEVVEVWLERMAVAYGDAAITDGGLAAARALLR